MQQGIGLWILEWVGLKRYSELLLILIVCVIVLLTTSPLLAMICSCVQCLYRLCNITTPSVLLLLLNEKKEYMMLDDDIQFVFLLYFWNWFVSPVFGLAWMNSPCNVAWLLLKRNIFNLAVVLFFPCKSVIADAWIQLPQTIFLIRVDRMLAQPPSIYVTS